MVSAAIALPMPLLAKHFPRAVAVQAEREIILTHAGKFGDMLYCLPIAAWLARQRGAQIHWVLPECFGPFRYISRLLMRQSLTSRVSLVPFKVENYDCGGQPYHFNPADYGYEGEYYNLGFRHYPTTFLPRFYAEEHGFGYDPHYTLDIGMAGLMGTDEVLRSSEGRMTKLLPDIEPLPTAIDLLTLARRIACAREFHSWFCGLAVLCWFARIPAYVYRMPGHASLDTYFPEGRTLTFREVTG